MKRTFWFGAGVAAGVALTRKAGRAARQATPAGLASNLGDAMRELAGAIGSFGAEVRAGMSEREQELHETVEQSTGVRTTHGSASTRRGRHAAYPPVDRPSPARRAPRAEG